MKKILLLSLAACLMLSDPAGAQVGKFIKNVSKNVKNDLLGTPQSNTSKNTRPEPLCACDNAESIVDLNKYLIDYSECSITVLSDGTVLFGNRITGEFYISSNGSTQGPYRSDDPRVLKLQAQGSENSSNLLEKYSSYISKKGDKYTISFGGKTYGPYAQITKFTVTRSGDKFVALVIQSLIATEDEGKKIEAAIKNAKTDQEKMDLAMQYSQMVQKKMMDNGGPQSMIPQIVSNTEVAKDNYMIQGGLFFDGMKYDEILVMMGQNIVDLKGKTVITISGAMCSPDHLYIKSDNSGYACYDSGSITFSDGRKMTDLFNPYLIKVDGKPYMAYFYYSPKRNSLMRCKIPF